MDWLRILLETSPMTTLFLVIAAGYLVGDVNFKGFALGSGAVLFVGLACGAFAPKAAPPGMLGTLGLLLFLYCVGIQYGGEWYRGLTSPSGLRANAVALCGLAASAAAALAMQRTGAAGLPESLGMFAGATTSTPALQAVLDALGSQDAAVGYSLSYPLGVAGPILCMYLYLALFKPTIATPADRLMKPAEVRVHNATLIGRRFVDFQQSLPKGVQAVAIRSGGQNRVPDPTTIVRANDVVLLVGSDPAAIGQALELVGEAAASIAVDRTALDYLRVFASKGGIVGMPLGSLKLPGGFAYSYVHVRRGDVDLLPDDDLVLEFGDRVGVLCHRADFDAVRRFFGDSIKGVADFSYISLGVGAAMGLLVGLIPFPVPGVGRITLGVAGVLLVALGLGHIRRTGIVWTLPLSANLVLRNFGLTVFLAQVGLASGPQFATTVAESGLTLLLLGAIIMLALIVVTMIAGRLLGIPADDLFGVVSGVTGNPAILAYASRAMPTDRPDIGYAMVFPSVTVAKILFAQIAASVLGS
ncbi:MAG TPA: TrkA C-terminal domain-containing protein [Vicinamibacterales bacterium]|nr:TrkA C-terminal domain-containing protein [Vicinamibacterales bacterium]